MPPVVCEGIQTGLRIRKTKKNDPDAIYGRDFVGVAATFSAGAATVIPVEGSESMASPRSVRDRFWLWGHAAGSHDRGWGLEQASRITPVEAAFYMLIPNLIMVRYEGRPKPPFRQYTLPLRTLREIVWSVVGAEGATDQSEREEVLRMASITPNLSGVMMDDFFNSEGDSHVAALTTDELRRFQSRLKQGQRQLDLWVALYDYQLDAPISAHLEHCDVVTLWTWEARNLTKLESNLEKLERLTPGKQRVLGCYMWNYSEKEPMPTTTMARQCEKGLEWLREGRINGMIFLASCICDLELRSVEWTRRWIRLSNCFSVI